MFLFDHGSLPQVGRVAPHVLRDVEHLRQSVRSMHSMTSSDNRQSYAERQEHREAEINGLKRSFEILSQDQLIFGLHESTIVAEVNKN